MKTKSLEDSLIETLESPQALEDYYRLMDILQETISEVGYLLSVSGRLGGYLVNDPNAKSRGMLALVTMKHWLTAFQRATSALDSLLGCPWIEESILYYAEKERGGDPQKKSGKEIKEEIREYLKAGKPK